MSRGAAWGHRDEPVAHRGAQPEEAAVAVVLVHGRGATAESILELVPHLLPEGDARRAGVAFLAPQAAHRTWYPQSFLAPLEANEPALTEALDRLRALVEDLGRRGVPRERTVLAGFSQGACLASECVARSAVEGSGTPWGGLAAWTGGLIGPRGTPRETAGDLAGTPVFLGSGDPDPHVPWWRVEETAELLETLGAGVTVRRYPGMPHTVNDEELAWLAGRIGELAPSERV